MSPKTKTREYEIEVGKAHPLGSTPDANGVNFSVYSENATGVELLLFDKHDQTEPSQTIRLDRARHKSFHFWHVYVKGLKPGTYYAYRVDGPWNLAAGHRFNRNKVLLDPYSNGNTNELWQRGAAVGPEDNVATTPRSVIIDLADYDWEGDKPLNLPMSETVIYEVHVRGFTKSANSGVKSPGTYSGFAEKAPYLKDLGVTAVELLPVFDFDEKDVLRRSPVDGSDLRNYWGYDPYAHFAPQSWYATDPTSGNHVNEFRDMVKALHKQGIEVILDVVFNHTGEGNHQGPAISFKGFENSAYYILVPFDRSFYMDYTGCGNTFNANHPIGEKYITDCLDFWVREMHVDGFRFDLGSILTRGPDGAPMAYPPVIWEIELSETLADTKIIAEAWDAGGLYQVGYFPGSRWAEWNGKYRDDMRRFIKGDGGLIGAVASRISGSADMYQSPGETAINSVNFITAHDGFTLHDLVSYNEKHNEANGEYGRDGANDNNSWNCGIEGDTDDPVVQELRRRQLKNFGAVLMLSRGVPMLLGGDEFGRSQGGNNNAYCQDNEMNWFDWDVAAKNEDLVRFFSRMIGFRRENDVLRQAEFFTGETNERGVRDVEWHGCVLGAPGWNDPGSQVLAFTLAGLGNDPDLHVMMNMSMSDLDFDVPTIEGRSWTKAIDTAAPSPQDFPDPKDRAAVGGDSCPVQHHSIVVLTNQEAKKR
jgi:glycogen operon protein